MRNLNIWILSILILTTLCLYSQDGLYIGMSVVEFKTKLPGILPDEIKFNEDLGLDEKLYTIDGRWGFEFNNNILSYASFYDKSNIESENEYNKWTESAKLIIEDYIKIYGQPVKYEKGTNKYLDRNNSEYHKTIGKREVFYEAIWKTKTMNIEISCDYRSNQPEIYIPNGDVEHFDYGFQIIYSTIPEIKNLKPENFGRFYLGMDVNDFAKVFPTLFPKGIKMFGQWHRNQELYGLTGSWAYQFKDGELTWIHYDKYIDEINDNNFKKCLSAANRLINDYTKLYGKPDTTLIGDTTFVDPYKKHHWGYDVIEARWKNYNEMKTKIEFTFMGGKGNYHFLVVINSFDKNYPYYD